MPLMKREIPVLSADLCTKVFLAGFCCIIAPLPQLLAYMSDPSSLLFTAFMPPAVGAFFMIAMLKCSGIKNVLPIHPLSLKDIIYCLCWTALIVVSSALVTFLWQKGLAALDIPFEKEQPLMSFAKNASTADFILIAVLVTVPVPIVEEILFRRVLYSGLLPHGKIFAAAAASAVFSLVHLYPGGIPGLFVIGCGFQLMYIRQRNLLTPIAGHMLLNMIAICSAATAG